MSDEPELLPFPNLEEMVNFYKDETGMENATPEELPVLIFTIKEFFCMSLLRQMDVLLPTEPAMPPSMVGPLLVRFMKHMFPEDTKFMEFRWLPDLLDPATAHRFPTAMSEPRYAQLRKMAEITAGMETDEAKKKYLQDLANGVMPPGIYSKQHSRWILRDAITAIDVNPEATKAYREEQLLKE